MFGLSTVCLHRSRMATAEQAKVHVSKNDARYYLSSIESWEIEGRRFQDACKEPRSELPSSSRR